MFMAAVVHDDVTVNTLLQSTLIMRKEKQRTSESKEREISAVICLYEKAVKEYITIVYRVELYLVWQLMSKNSSGLVLFM